MVRTWLAAAAFGAALGMFAAAQAETLHYTARLDGSQETPPNLSKGAGHADVTVDTETHKLKWVMDFSGLGGPATMAHFHGPAEPGKAAGVLVPIGAPLTSPSTGESTLTDEQIVQLRAGMVYLNIHTAEHPAGEIRGQVTPAH